MHNPPPPVRSSLRKGRMIGCAWPLRAVSAEGISCRCRVVALELRRQEPLFENSNLRVRGADEAVTMADEEVGAAILLDRIEVFVHGRERSGLLGLEEKIPDLLDSREHKPQNAHGLPHRGLFSQVGRRTGVLADNRVRRALGLGDGWAGLVLAVQAPV